MKKFIELVKSFLKSKEGKVVETVAEEVVKTELQK
jgi:hypothetical protein